jgi:C4-dicarboxylate-specific signal transduction histidine kinase
MERLATLGKHAASLAHGFTQPFAGMRSNAQAAAHLLASDEARVDELRAILARVPYLRGACALALGPLAVPASRDTMIRCLTALGADDSECRERPP